MMPFVLKTFLAQNVENKANKTFFYIFNKTQIDSHTVIFASLRAENESGFLLQIKLFPANAPGAPFSPESEKLLVGLSFSRQQFKSH